jgi:hypothetical protein
MDTLQSADSKTMVYSTIGLHSSLPKALYETRFHWGTVDKGETLYAIDGTGTACQSPQSPQSQPSSDIITVDGGVAKPFSDLVRSHSSFKKELKRRVQVIKKRQGEFLAFSQKIGSVLSISAPDNRVNELKCYKGSQFILLKQLAESYPEEAMLYYQQVKASVEVRCRFKRNRKYSEVPPHTNLKTSRK